MAISKKRLALLGELERIVGNECYNAKIQNWGPGGVFEGEGRGFRYPITFVDGEKKVKVRYSYPELSKEAQMSGSYMFGTNELHIMRALDKIISHLEQHSGLKI